MRCTQKQDFAEEDGNRAAELEDGVCGDGRLGGRDRSRESLLQGLGVPVEQRYYDLMSHTDARPKR